jgi:hypothetical protein
MIVDKIRKTYTIDIVDINPDGLALTISEVIEYPDGHVTTENKIFNPRNATELAEFERAFVSAKLGFALRL